MTGVFKFVNARESTTWDLFIKNHQISFCFLDYISFVVYNLVFCLGYFSLLSRIICSPVVTGVFLIREFTRQQCPITSTWNLFIKNHQILRFSGRDWSFFSIHEFTREQFPTTSTWKFPQVYHDQMTSGRAQQDQRSPLLPQARKVCE